MGEFGNSIHLKWNFKHQHEYFLSLTWCTVGQVFPYNLAVQKTQNNATRNTELLYYLIENFNQIVIYDTNNLEENEEGNKNELSVPETI